MTRTSSAALFATIVLFALAGAACNGNDGPPKERFPIVGDPARVEMVEGGPVGATERLRWKPTAGTAQRVELVIATDSLIEAQGQTIPVKIDMRMTCDVRVKSVAPDGSFVADLVFQDFDMDMPQTGPMASLGSARSMMKDMLRGATMELTLDARGHVVRSSFGSQSSLGAALGDLEKQLDDNLGQLAFPFPEEPVAVGSKWNSYTTQTAANGLEMRIVTHYELVALDGDKGKVKTTVEQFADAQPIKVGTGAASAKLKSMKSSGSGETDFDLTRPLVGNANATLEMKLRVDASMGTQTADMSMKTDMRFTAKDLGAAPAAAAPAKH